jgi:hypothetical protein
MLDFGLCFFAVILCLFIPACNALLGGFGYFCARSLVSAACSKTAMADSRQLGIKSAKAIESELTNPRLTGFQQIVLSPPAPSAGSSVAHAGANDSVQVNIMVEDDNRVLGCWPASEQLPKFARPSATRDRVDRRYFYQLSVHCTLNPFFHLSGIPIIGQLPMVGAPVPITLTERERVQLVRSLEY